MPLSGELVAKFAKLMNEPVNTNTEETLYGTARVQDDKTYVRIDGSEYYTPVVTTSEVKTGERVMVTIKDHNAIAVGNLSSPSASKSSLDDLTVVVADKVSTDELEAVNAYIDDLVAQDVTINGKLEAAEANIEKLTTEKLDATYADITYAQIADLNATNAHIDNLEAEYGSFKDLTAEDLEAINAFIDSADIKYANIDFANIGEAAIEKLFAESGIIGDLVMEEGHVTGKLVGVTIIGDLIEGGTVVADKLVIQGEDGLYYKLNTNGETISAQQTEYNSLHGSIITAQSVTAEKINVSDLVAFNATIGGYHITEDSLYSGVKEGPLNTTRGVYMDNDGQFALGDTTNYLRFYKDTDGAYKLAISASEINFSTSNKNLEAVINGTIVGTVEEFYKSSSPTELVGGTWSTSQPVWEDGTYLWRRTKVTYADDSFVYTPSEMGVCITGNTGSSADSSITETKTGETVEIGENMGRVPLDIVVYGKTRKNFWTNPPSTTKNGITVTSNEDGSITISGASTGETTVSTIASYSLKPGVKYTVSVDSAVSSGTQLYFAVRNYIGTASTALTSFGSDTHGLAKTFTVPSTSDYVSFMLYSASVGETNSGTYHVMLNEGSTIEPWCPPGLTSIDELSVKIDEQTIPIDLKGNKLCSLPDGTSDELHIDQNGNVKIVKRIASDDLDETDPWAISGGDENNFYLSDLDDVYDFSVENNAYCDDYSTITNSEYNDGVTGIRFGKSTFGLTNLWVCDSRYSGVDAFKTALSTNPISIVAKATLDSEVTLDKVTIPALNAAGSTITTVAPITTNISITYWGEGGKEIVEAWDKANEALEAVENTKTELKEYTDSQIAQTSESITSTVTEKVSETITSSVDGLQQQITNNETNITELEQTANGWDFNFSTIQTTITELGDKVETNQTEMLKYIRFINGEIWIGEVAQAGEDEFMAVISNERISFRQNGSEIAYLSNNKLYITNATVSTQLDIGNFSWRPRSNGNTTLVFTG